MRRCSNTALWKGLGAPIIAHILAQKTEKGVIVPDAWKISRLSRLTRHDSDSLCCCCCYVNTATEPRLNNNSLNGGRQRTERRDVGEETSENLSWQQIQRKANVPPSLHRPGGPCGGGAVKWLTTKQHHASLFVCGQREEGGCYGLRLDGGSGGGWGGGSGGGAAIMSDAPRGTSALWGCASPARTACRPAAQTQPRSAWPPRRRTWWLAGSAARSGTQRKSRRDGEETNQSNT